MPSEPTKPRRELTADLSPQAWINVALRVLDQANQGLKREGIPAEIRFRLEDAIDACQEVRELLIRGATGGRRETDDG